MRHDTITSLATVRVIGLVLLASPLVLVHFAAWIVCLRIVSLNWMSRASTCLHVAFSCRACVSCRAHVSLLLGGLCTAACRACFTKLDVTRVIWLAAGLPRACCKTDLIYKWTSSLCIHTLHRKIP